MVLAAFCGDDQSSAAVLNLRQVSLDPNTHAFVVATAAITSVAFTISTLNVLAVILSHLLN
jgi:hypothetical protein